MQKAMGRTLFFIALKHGANTFFAVSSHGADTFSTTLKPMRRYLQKKNAVAAIFFNEIADSDWNAVAPIEVNWKKHSDTARNQYSKYYHES